MNKFPETGPEKEAFKYEGRAEATTDKRFEIQRDEFVRERLVALRDCLAELQNEHPEIMGLTIYGSITKGRAVEESDVDCVLFIDADKLMMIDPNADVKTIHSISPSGRTEFVDTYAHEEVNEGYRELLRKTIARKIPDKDPEKLLDIGVYPTSARIIDYQIARVKDRIDDFFEYLDAIEEHKGKLAILSPEEDLPEEPKKPLRIEIGGSLFALFHLQVGHGLDQLRNEVIDRIEQEDRLIRDTLWKSVIKMTEAFEQYDNMDSKYYPRTFEEAKKVYQK